MGIHESYSTFFYALRSSDRRRRKKSPHNDKDASVARYVIRNNKLVSRMYCCLSTVTITLWEEIIVNDDNAISLLQKPVTILLYALFCTSIRCM